MLDDSGISAARHPRAFTGVHWLPGPAMPDFSCRTGRRIRAGGPWSGRHHRGAAMTMESKTPPSDADLARLVDVFSAVNGIAMAPEWTKEVQAHLKVAFAMAELVERQPLPDAAEPRPVFTP
jgi:hypothetical protein